MYNKIFVYHYIREYIMTTNILLYIVLYNEKYTFMYNKIFVVIIQDDV